MVNLARMLERHALQVPNVGPDESATFFLSIADGDDEDSMGIESSWVPVYEREFFTTRHT